MKIFFHFSPEKLEKFKAKYQKIYQVMEILGNQIIGVDFRSIKSKKASAKVNVDQPEIKLIQEADVCVFEVSAPSLSAGYLIGKTLELNKPVVILYFKNNSPSFFLKMHEEKLIVHQYQASNLEKKVREALLAVKQLKDRRFNFFISADLLTYLEETSRKLKITKSTFIRNLILEHQRKNR